MCLLVHWNLVPGIVSEILSSTLSNFKIGPFSSESVFLPCIVNNFTLFSHISCICMSI